MKYEIGNIPWGGFTSAMVASGGRIVHPAIFGFVTQCEISKKKKMSTKTTAGKYLKYLGIL
jgi:hypothetical protein